VVATQVASPANKSLCLSGPRKSGEPDLVNPAPKVLRHVQGALNRKDGRTDQKTFLDIQGICNVLAGTDGLAAPEALRRISS